MMPVADLERVSVAREHPRPDASLRSPAADDPMARRLLQRAQGAFQKWPEGFTGFSASLRYRTPRHEVQGHVRVVPGLLVEARLPDLDLAADVERILSRMAGERVPRFFKDGDGRFPLTLEPVGGEGQGCRIRVHRDGGAGLTYRLDAAGRLRAFERHAGAQRIVTTFEALGRATPGRFLPTRTVSSCFEAATGALLRTVTVVDVHRRLEHVWLPGSREWTVAEAGACRTTALDLDGHVLL